MYEGGELLLMRFPDFEFQSEDLYTHKNAFHNNIFKVYSILHLSN
jgi:hypothetical protein